jgi:hypothetical protein
MNIGGLSPGNFAKPQSCHPLIGAENSPPFLGRLQKRVLQSDHFLCCDHMQKERKK